jgi:hypothetical protein
MRAVRIVWVTALRSSSWSFALPVNSFREELGTVIADDRRASKAGYFWGSNMISGPVLPPKHVFATVTIAASQLVVGPAEELKRSWTLFRIVTSSQYHMRTFETRTEYRLRRASTPKSPELAGS